VIWKDSFQVNIPKSNVVAVREHFLPKHELELRNDFAGLRLFSSNAFQVTSGAIQVPR
jgi:hypothetical protein